MLYFKIQITCWEKLRIEVKSLQKASFEYHSYCEELFIFSFIYWQQRAEDYNKDYKEMIKNENGSPMV